MTCMLLVGIHNLSSKNEECVKARVARAEEGQRERGEDEAREVGRGWAC